MFNLSNSNCRVYVLVVLAFGVSLYAATAMAEEPYQIAWTRQLGTIADDGSNSVAVDGFGNAYISGYTDGNLGGPNAGSYGDAYLAKYNPEGILLWTKQLGTSTDDGSNSVAVDNSGYAWISGATFGSLGGPNAGNWDAFLARYDPAGNLLWKNQIGTYLWDHSRCVAVDASGNAYITGETRDSLGGTNAGSRDAFLVKYDPAGNLLWTSETDESKSVGVDKSGNVYISGWTNGSLDDTIASGHDAFLAKYAPDGNLLWTKQLSAVGANDTSNSVALDGDGNAYISGYTSGNLGGSVVGGYDAFLAKYDPSGNLVWTEQIGTVSNDFSACVTADLIGNVWISGYTEGDLGGLNAGGRDAFLVKFTVPEPATLSLLLVGGLGLARRRRR